MLTEYLARGPRKYLPALETLLLVCLEKVLIGLEVGQHGHIAPEAVPAQLQDCKWQEFHHIEGGTHRTTTIFQKHWPDGLLCVECALLHVQHAATVGCAAFGKNEEGCILSCLLNEVLAITDGT